MERGPRPAAWCAIAGVVLFPVLPWLLVGPVGERFEGHAALHSIANLSAFFAIATWAVNLVLASRLHFIERALGGLEKLYYVHRRLGVLVVVLAVDHAVFLSLYARGDALDLYLPSAGWSTFSGVIALLALLGLVSASLVTRLEYQTFLRAQRLLGGAFVVGAFHAIAVRGTAASSAVLTVYLACLAAAGATSLGYRVFGARLGLGRRRYRVAEIRVLAEDAVEIVMAPLGEPLRTTAGQFVYATFHQDGIPRESHPFSVASAPGDELRIAVKRFGDFTSTVMGLRVGTEAQLEGPFGNFRPNADQLMTQTWIAGGIGITPFLSWARTVDDELRVDLYYCMSRADQGHFLDEIYEIADQHPRLRIIPISKSSLGRLTVDDIEGVNPSVWNGHVYICGPPAMIDNMRSGFAARGIPPERIHSESLDFRARARAARAPYG